MLVISAMNKIIIVWLLLIFVVGGVSAKIADASDEGKSVMHEVEPPVHQWISYQASKVWSVPEITSFINKNDYSAVWESEDDFYCDRDGYDSSEGILVGSCEEDRERVPNAPSWCWFTGTPSCWHFWEPDIAQNGEYNYGYQGVMSSYVRAQYLWDNYVIENYPFDKARAYYWLGRVAHLLEDLTVPAHVHDDGHPSWIDDDEYELFCPRIYQDFDGGDYIREYYAPESLDFDWENIKKNPSDLFKLFWYVAQKTQYYASDDVDGNEYFSDKNGEIYSFSENLWENEINNGIEIISDKDEVENFFGDGNDENLKKIAQANIPHAIKAVAGLYRLFWIETHDIKPCNPELSQCCDGNLGIPKESPCCNPENGMEKDTDEQPTGYNDMYVCEGDNVIYRDFYCDGQTPFANIRERFIKTCKPCGYCLYGSCSFYPSGTSCGANAECDGNGRCRRILEGDANGDCVVNILDLIFVRNRVGVQEKDNWKADANNDGKIDIADLIFVRNHLNERC